MRETNRFGEKKEKLNTRSGASPKSTPKSAKRGGHGRDEHKTKGGKTTALSYVAIYKVNRSDELLEFLLRKCNTSRNNVKSLLTKRQILVNGSVVTQYNFVLAKDDEVKISKTSVGEKTSQKPTQSQAQKRAPRPKLTILYETDEFIAVDKPVGLLSVESDKQTECAFGYVMQYLQAQDKSIRPFILHRIDKETSGVLLFAKDVKIHSMLKMKWNEYVQTREYYAVAEGVFEQKEGTIISYLKENANNLVYATQDPSGQKAVTHYTVIEQNAKYALLRVKIDTGRKNQIRVQLHAQGHPVVGDDKYGFTHNPLGRLGLHASKLEFIHPVSRELITITAPVPASFRKLF